MLNQRLICKSFHRSWGCQSWEKEQPAIACARSSAPWPCWCFISTSQSYSVCVFSFIFLNIYQIKHYYLIIFGMIHYKLFPLLSYCPSGTGEADLTESEALLEPYIKKFPNVSSLFCWFWLKMPHTVFLLPCPVKSYHFELIWSIWSLGGAHSLLHCKNCIAQRKLHLCEYL